MDPNESHSPDSPREPTLVQLVGDDNLGPFEEQTLTIARRTYWVNIFAFLAAFAVACFVAVQVAEMKDQTQILASQAEADSASASLSTVQVQRQLAISQQQAKAAQDSVTAIQHQMRQDQRAWIQVRLSLPDNLAENQPVTGLGQLTNIGKTPAKRVITEVVIEMVSNGRQPEFKYNNIPRLAETIGFLLPNVPPENSTPQLFHRTGNSAERTLLTREDISNLTSGKAFLVIHSRTRYYDIFGTSHWIKSCGWKPYAPGYHEFTVRACTNYQDVDNN